jgi:hypothetical protein
MAMPNWKEKLDETNATNTTFKLADSGKSVSPAGTVILPLMMGGQMIMRKFWVLKDLTTTMIIGTDLLNWIGATVDYPKMRSDLGNIPRWEAYHSTFEVRVCGGGTRQ